MVAEQTLLQEAGREPLDNLDFAKTARKLGIEGIEYVNQMFFDKAKDQAYLGEMKKRAEGEGVKSLLIMCDREGNLGDPDDAKRAKTIENHLKWLDAAEFLGCHSIRVNAASDASSPRTSRPSSPRTACTASARRATSAASGSWWKTTAALSSNGKWLTQVMKLADHKRVGILPDFGNFYTNRDNAELYNPYQGLREFMPWVKQAVSAKAYDWDTGAGKFYTEDRREPREITSTSSGWSRSSSAPATAATSASNTKARSTPR